MRALGPLLFLAGLTGCSAPHVIEARFPSGTIRSATRRVQTFLYGPETADRATDCAALDPRGRPPGDAPSRTGLEPAARADGPIADVLADLNDVPGGTYALVIEAWGPTCAELGGGTGGGCVRFSADGGEVLRGYYCNTFDLGNGQTLDIVADLESFVGIGAEMEVPSEISQYTEDNPLDVASGERARQPFVVRLLDVDSDEREDVAVHFSIVSGRATIEEPQPIRTTRDGDPLGGGIAAATLRVGADAHTIDDGRIIVEAYAPGFDRAPVRFAAHAVPSVDVATTVHRLPPDRVNLQDIEYAAQPIVPHDIDGDGDVDFLTFVGQRNHRLVVLEQTDDGYQVRLGPERPGQARALVVAQLLAGTRSIVVSASDFDPGPRRSTPDGNTYVAQNPRVEIYQSAAVSTAPTVITTLDGADLEKLPIAISAGDLDGDGLDELALSQCSYVYRTGSGQSRFIACYSKFTDHSDSEIVVWRREDATSLTFTRAATVPAEGNDGGFREVLFEDINGDQSLDLVSVGDSNLVGICGQKNQPGAGYGFESNTRFFENISFAESYALATGHFDDDNLLDIVATGGLRAASPVGGIKVLGGGGCEQFRDGPDSIITGPRTQGHQLSVRTANLNDDAWTDVVMRHGPTRNLRIFLGGGALGLAQGPVVELPSGTTAGLALAEETIGGKRAVVAAVLLREENALAVVRITPR